MHGLGYQDIGETLPCKIKWMEKRETFAKLRTRP